MSIISKFFSIKRSIKHSHGYKHHRNDYYKQHNRIISNRVLSNLFIKARKFDIQFNTSTEITPLKLKFGIYYYEVIRELGKPRFEINQDIGNKHRVLFYRKNISDYNFLSQLHFYANQLVFVKSDFDYLSHGADGRRSILRSLFQKYSIISNYEFSKNIVIKDADNNIVTISDVGKISLQYFAGNEMIVNSILDLNIKNISLAKKTELELALIQSVV